MEPANFTFADDRMFSRVMSDPSICRRVLERILGVRIDRVEYHNTQQESEIGLFAHGIRMDAYLESEDAVYDIEMQSRDDPCLARRLRYYQSAIDSGLLERGMDYDLLPESWVIFLCGRDPFGQGIPTYTLERACLEDAGLEVECGSHWLVLNASAWEKEGDGALRSLLQYVENGTVAKGDSLMNDIDEAVFAANHDARWTDSVFSVSTIEEDIARNARIRIRHAAREAAREAAQKAAREARAKALVEGKAEGLAEGKAEGLAKGKEEGIAEGEALGKAEAEARYNRLVRKLSAEGRLEELALAADDPALLEALFEEL